MAIVSDFGGEFGGVVDIVAQRLDMVNMQLVLAAVCKHVARCLVTAATARFATR